MLCLYQEAAGLLDQEHLGEPPARLGGLNAIAPQGRCETAGTSPCAVPPRRNGCYLGPLLCRMELCLVATTATWGILPSLVHRGSAICALGGS